MGSQSDRNKKGDIKLLRVDSGLQRSLRSREPSSEFLITTEGEIMEKGKREIDKIFTVGDLASLLNKSISRARALRLNWKKTDLGMAVSFEDVVDYVESHPNSSQIFQLCRLKRIEGRLKAKV